MRNLYRTLAVCTLCVLALASCKEPLPPVPSVDPVFPDLVEKNDVEPGSVLTLTFEANMDWTVSVPSESLQWFWINDGSFKVDKISGKVIEGETEKVNFTIGVSETEEFDANRSCEVTLSMGGKSNVIAKYMRPAKGRTLSVFAAKVVDGEFVLNGAGGYEYESVEAASLDLIWSSADADFRMPVRIESNCGWLADIPEWMEMQVPENTVGVLEVVLTGASVDAASGKVTFKSDDNILKQLDVNVPACGVVDLYTTQMENGDFLFDAAGEYLFAEEPASEVTLVWPGSDFRMPVMTDAKCDWTLELPQWLTVRYGANEPKTNSGIVKFVLMGNPLYYPLEETTENMVFKFAGKVIHEIPVTIPGCKDMFGFGLDMSMTSWVFNPQGNLMTSTGFQDVKATAWITGTSEAEVLAVETVDGKSLGTTPSWIAIDVQPYVQGDNVLQQRSVTVSPSVNDGNMRSAYILFSKDGNIDAFFESDGSLKAGMEDYAVSVTQYGSDMEYVTMTSSESDMSSAGVTLAESTNPRLTSWFGKTDFTYELTYSNPYARDKAFMSFAAPFSTYKIFNNAREDKTSDAGFWLKFVSENAENKAGVIDMYNGMSAPDAKSIGYVVFYDADGSTLAIIVAVYDPEKQAEVEVNVEFVGESATYAEMVGATLEEVTSVSDKELYDIYKEYNAPIYHLTYRMLGMPMRISIPSDAVRYNPNPFDKRHNFLINGLDYDDTVGEFGLIDGGVDVYMILDEGSSSEYEQGQIFFHREDLTVTLVLICTLDLTGTY